MSFFQSGNLREAEAAFKKLLRREPRHPVVLSVLGAVLTGLGKFGEAEPHLQAALKFNPNAQAVLYNLGLALKGLGRPEEALARFTQVLVIDPRDAEALNNRGTVFNDLKAHEQALADFDKALALQPASAAVMCNRGNALCGLDRHEEALAAYQAALKRKPDLAEAWFSLGFVFDKLGRHAEAADAYAEALHLNPDIPFLKGILLHQRMLCADWRGHDETVAGIARDIDAGRLAADPFGWQGLATSNRSLQRCATLYNKTRYPAAINQKSPARPDHGGIIRIGYVSGEFRSQATSLLLVGVLEQHDRAAFEIHAFDNGHDDGSEIRGRIEKAVHRIHSIRALGDAQAAGLIRDSGIDILVNLNGYFGDHRTGVFAQRPAPVQVNYLGFPGTMGAAYMDYIVADATVIPLPERPFFTEKVVHLPDCYQANDRERPISGHLFGREELGLPADGFVFCCFNNSYKITPGTFDRWMRILHRIPGSVLWLLKDSETASTNLAKEAAARGIDPQRLVFATRLPLPEHLARHRCADLFLDTLPYNAHTTASDALWAGLPVLTCAGETFAGRVAASLLNTIGLPELVTSSSGDYENLAAALATQPERLAAIRRKLADNRLTTPLFDTTRFTRNLERAYIAMHERGRKGARPDHIEIVDS
jgi:predicted O-linked N-acetylglucosamine transferase (SPINDLY family)